jgi:hypothetical protein
MRMFEAEILEALTLLLAPILKLSCLLDGYGNLIIHKFRQYRDNNRVLSQIFQAGRFLRAVLGVLLFLGLQQILYGIPLIVMMVFGLVLIDVLKTQWQKLQNENKQ